LAGCGELEILKLAGVKLRQGFKGDYLVSFKNLKMVDLSGIGKVEKPLLVGNNMRLVIRIGADGDEFAMGQMAFMV
jgi:hypothetical protein